MSYSSYRVPPALDYYTTYEKWLEDIYHWCELTELPPDKRALAIHLSLTGKARKITSGIKIEDLKHADGVQMLLKRLDDLLNVKVSSCQPIAVSKPIVYMVLMSAGRSLGRIRIQLTCGPRRSEQMLMLCSPRGGNTFGGSHFDEARDVGQPGESIICQGYMTRVGDRCDTAIVSDLEEDECEMYVSGTVTQGRGNEAGFIICTRTDPLYTDRQPELGHVVEGIDILRKTMEQLTTKSLLRYNASEISIAYVGIHTNG